MKAHGKHLHWCRQAAFSNGNPWFPADNLRHELVEGAGALKFRRRGSEDEGCVGDVVTKTEAVRLGVFGDSVV